MNVKSTKEFFEDNNVAALRAYKSDEYPEVEQQLVKLGNKVKGIPFYAVYGPGFDKPKTFDGYITAGGIQEILAQAKSPAGVSSRENDKPRTNVSNVSTAENQ